MFCTIHSINDLVNLACVLTQVSCFLLSKGMLAFQESFLTIWMLFNLITFWLIFWNTSLKHVSWSQLSFYMATDKLLETKKMGKVQDTWLPIPLGSYAVLVVISACVCTILVLFFWVLMIDGVLALESYKWSFGRYFWHVGQQWKQWHKLLL